MTNPLVAQAPQEGSGFTQGTGDNGWATGISIAESAMDTFNGFKDGSWIEGGLGVVGLAADAASMAIDPFGTLLSSAASFLMEHVQPLKDMLDWLAGDPPVIESYSTTWNNVATEMGKISQDYATALNSGTTGWTGAAADAYRAAATQQGDALSGAASAAGSVGTVVGVMGMVVAFVREMVRDLIADLVAKLITWVLEAVFSLGFGTPVIVAQAITAISKWAARIAKLVQKLLDTIKKVSPMLKRLVEVFEKIMKVLGKLAGKATGLDVLGTKIDDPGFVRRMGRDGADGPSGGSSGNPGTSGSRPEGDEPSGSGPDNGSPSTTPSSGSTSPGGTTTSPGGSSSPDGSSPNSPGGPTSTPGGRTPNSPDGPTSSPSGSTPTSASGSTPPTHSGQGSSPGGTPNSPDGPTSPPSGTTPAGRGPDSSPGSSPSAHGPSSPGSTPSHSFDGGSTPSAHSPSGGATTNPSSSPAPNPVRTDQTHTAATTAPDAPGRADQPQTAAPRDTTPSSAPPQQGAPTGGGAPHAGGPSSAGSPPRTGGGGWTGTSGHRGDTASGVPQARTPDSTPRPQNAGPPQARTPFAGPPHAGPPPVRSPQAGPPHAGPARPPQASPPHTGPPQPRHPHPGPTHSGPPHQNTPHQPQARGPEAPHHAGPDSPPHQPEPRPSLDEAHARHAETTPAGVSHHRGDSDMGDLPSRVPNDPHHFTADVHITPDGRARVGNHTYSPEEYGDLLRRSGWDGKTPIRLIGCDAGANDFAKRLSAHTDAPVLAPTKPAWTDSQGRVYTSDAEVDAHGNRQPKIPPNGEWETHSPDGTRTRASEDGFAPGTRDGDKDGLDPTDARDRQRPVEPITDPPDRDPTPQQSVRWNPTSDLPEVHVRDVDPNQRVLDFDGGPPLEPNSRVVVHNPDGSVRGTYYTGANSNVTHVDTSVPNTRNGPVNPDVQRPAADVVYRVDTGTSTHTFQGQEIPDRARTDTTDTTDSTGGDGSPDRSPESSPDRSPADRFDEFDQSRTPPAVEWDPRGGLDGNYRQMPAHENYDPSPPPDGDGPFSLRGNDPDNRLASHARYDVADADGNWHGTFYTDADGRVSHVHTWSGNSEHGFNPELGTSETQQAGLPVPAPNTTFAVGPRHVDGMDPTVPQQMYRTDAHGDTAAASGRPVYPPSGTTAEEFWGPRRGVEPGSPGAGVQPDTGRIASGGPEGFKDARAGEYPPFNYYGNRHELFKFDGGHIVPFEGGGPGERINHVPQWAYENRGMRIDGGPTDDTWRRMEEDVSRRAAEPGTTVDRVDFFSERTTPDVHTPDVLHMRIQYTVSDPPPPTSVQQIRSFQNVPEPARGNRVVPPPPTP